MQYEPIKNSLGRFFSGPVFLRKLFYFLLHLLLLRSWHVRKALRQIKKAYPGQADILDAGSGLGQYTWHMSGMNHNWRIHGVDINMQQVEECNAFFRKAGETERITFEPADLTTYIKPGGYDLILSVDVMEHIADDESVFRNFFTSLKSEGIVLISTPSDQGGSDTHDESDESFIGEHVRNGYGSAEISDKLQKAGFSKISTQYTYGRAGSLSWRLSMKYPVKLLNRSRLFYAILPFYYLVVFPVSLILNLIDVSFRNKTGTGLLVIARKM